MHSEKTKALIGLNIGVLIMSMAGLFAKLITWNPVLIILGRASLAAPFLGLYLVMKKKSFRPKKRVDTYILIALGIMMMLHWSSFFAAIQASSVAIGILAVFTSPIITTFLEPLFDGGKAHREDVLIALVAFTGIALMVDDYSLGSSTLNGVLLGIVSAILVSTRNVISKPLIQKYTAPVVMFWQMVFGALFLLPSVFVLQADVSMVDIRNLLILALFATAISHTLMLNSIGHLGARSTQIIMMVQPLYAIALAAVLLGEIPTVRIVVGGLLVLSAAGVESFKQAKPQRA